MSFSNHDMVAADLSFFLPPHQALWTRTLVRQEKIIASSCVSGPISFGHRVPGANGKRSKVRLNGVTSSCRRVMVRLGLGQGRETRMGWNGMATDDTG